MSHRLWTALTVLALLSGCSAAEREPGEEQSAAPVAATTSEAPTVRDLTEPEQDYLDAFYKTNLPGRPLSPEKLGLSTDQLLAGGRKFCDLAEDDRLNDVMANLSGVEQAADNHALMQVQLTHGARLCPGTDATFAEALATLNGVEPDAGPTSAAGATAADSSGSSVSGSPPSQGASPITVPTPRAAPQTPAPTTPPRSVPAPTSGEADKFDEDYARTVVGWVVEDIAEADERMLDRPELGASTTMNFLSDDMGRLLDAGMPPVADEANYYGLVTTLEEFFGRAGDEMPYDVNQAAATYTVARGYTEELIAILNPVLGTKHALPAWTWM